MKSIKNIFFAVMIAVVAAGAYYFLSVNHFFIKDENLKEILKLSDIYGNKISGPKGKKFIILNFWATWCPPCVEETPSLIRFAERNNNDFYLIALSQDDSIKEIFSFINTFPSMKSQFINIIHDSGRGAARAYKVNKLPETFIYSIEMNRIIQFSGLTNWDDPKILELIQKTFN